MKETNKVLIDETKKLFDKTNSYKDLLIQKNNIFNQIKILNSDFCNLILEMISCYNDYDLLKSKRELINKLNMKNYYDKELNNLTITIGDLDKEICSLKICSISMKKYKDILINKKKNLIKKRDNISIIIRKLDKDIDNFTNQLFNKLVIKFTNQLKKPCSSKQPVFKLEGIKRDMINNRCKVDKLNKKLESIDIKIADCSTYIDTLEKKITLLYGNSCSSDFIFTHNDFQ